jgi:hypothetical protein
VILLAITYVAQIVFIPLDVFRYHLMPKPGAFVSFLGLALYVGGWCIFTLAMRVNPFAVPVVRSQKEGDQRVIDTGVYVYGAASNVRGVRPDGRGSSAMAGIVCGGFDGDHSNRGAGDSECVGGTIFETGTGELRNLHAKGPLAVHSIFVVTVGCDQTRTAVTGNPVMAMHEQPS